MKELEIRLISRCKTDVFYDCAVSRLFVDIVKLALKLLDLCSPRARCDNSTSMYNVADTLLRAVLN